MPFSVQEFGGLAVAFNPVDHRHIQAELTRLDPLLFLDPEVEPHGPRGPYVYLTVKQHVGSGHPPVTVLEWRGSEGPWPLTYAIVEQVKRQEGAIATAYVEAVAANELKRQQAVNDVGEKSYEVAMDARKASGKTSALLPRGQGLRMARDRARSKGRNV